MRVTPLIVCFALGNSAARYRAPDDPPHSVDIPSVVGYHIAKLHLKHNVYMLNLAPLNVRSLVRGDEERRNQIAFLTIEPKYPATHSEAVRLLKEFPEATGLAWISRQTGEDRAYVFYDPPLSSNVFGNIETIALDSPRGMQLIDRALARANMYRLDSSALGEELQPELPSDLDP